MPAESKSLSEFPRALEVLSGALLLISNPSGQDSFDTNSALLTEVAQAMLNVHYTQELGDVSVFDAIKNTRVLSGTTTPTSALGVDGQLYIKYETTGGVDEVVAMYFKKSSAWLEISLGGGGNTDYIECTQAQYDAWEQGGTLDPDTLYFITDGNIGNDIIDDSTASETTVYSSDKVEDLLSDKADYSVITGLNIQTQYIDSSDSYFMAYKVGKLVFVKARLKASGSIGNNYGLIYGLPAPLDLDSSLMPVLRDGHDFNNSSNIKFASCVINSSGTMLLQVYPDTIASGDYLYINSMYISA